MSARLEPAVVPLRRAHARRRESGVFVDEEAVGAVEPPAGLVTGPRLLVEATGDRRAAEAVGFLSGSGGRASVGGGPFENDVEERGCGWFCTDESLLLEATGGRRAGTAAAGALVIVG